MRVYWYTIFNTLLNVLFGKIICFQFSEKFNGFLFLFSLLELRQNQIHHHYRKFTEKISNYLVVGNELNLCVDVQWRILVIKKYAVTI